MKRVFLGGLNLLAKLWNKALCLLCGRKGVVLVFHEVSDSFDHDESCKIRQSSFRRIIERVAANYKIVPVDEFLSSKEKNMAVITFDDVPNSFYSEAYPFLKEKELPFTLFVAKKFVGMNGFLSAEEILSLDKDPLCTIGAHTCNHVQLRYESNSEYDIKESKLFLEELLGHQVKYMAYPYGRYDSVSGKNRREVKKSGFVAAFSTIQACVPNRYKKWFIPRIEVIE